MSPCVLSVVQRGRDVGLAWQNTHDIALAGIGNVIYIEGLWLIDRLIAVLNFHPWGMGFRSCMARVRVTARWLQRRIGFVRNGHTAYPFSPHLRASWCLHVGRANAVRV